MAGFFYFYLRDFFIEKSESKSTGKKRFKYLGLRALRYSDSDIIKNKMFEESFYKSISKGTRN